MHSIKIAPSILAADFSCLKDEMIAIDKAGADYIHLDVMDGHFVPNISFGASVIKALRPHSQKVFDAHLMISNPEKYIHNFVEAGADIITIHAESTQHLHRLVHLVKSFNIKVGVSLNPATPLSFLDYIIKDIDMVLIMTVNPGFGGQSFIPNMLDKIAQTRRLIEHSNPSVDLQVDGGIHQENVQSVIDAGADVIVAGSAVFKGNSKNYQNNIALLRGKRP